jgi:hypothetical protein
VDDLTAEGAAGEVDCDVVGEVEVACGVAANMPRHIAIAKGAARRRTHWKLAVQVDVI